MNQFKITEISNPRYSHTDYWGLNGSARNIYTVTVYVEVEASYWNILNKQGQLGQLYGIDISNEVYRLNSNINASRPVVSHDKRASKGIKRITLQYEMRHVPAKLRLIKGEAA